MNIGGFLALLAAFNFSLTAIFIRKGLAQKNPGDIWDIRVVSTFTSMLVFIFALLLLILLDHNIKGYFKDLSFQVYAIIILAGIAGPVVGATMNSAAISQIGASHSATLWAASNPLFATIFGVLLLKEMPDIAGFFSILLIIVGIMITGFRGHAGTKSLLEKTRLTGGIIALLSGLFVAISQVGRGAALVRGATPLSVLFFYEATPLIPFLFMVFIIKSRNIQYYKEVSRLSILYYSISGISFISGNFFLLLSFTFIPVWQSVAIRSVQPIIVVILSIFFLRKTDIIKLRLVMGSLLITLGVVFLNIRK